MTALLIAALFTLPIQPVHTACGPAYIHPTGHVRVVGVPCTAHRILVRR